VKLGIEAIPAKTAAGTLLGCLLLACASTPRQTLSQRLDPDTATTVTLLERPVELVAQGPRAAQNDPFAFLAPFETDRMGERTLFLWIAVPQDVGGSRPAQLLCDSQPIELQPAPGDLQSLGLSHPPYRSPAPWSTQWYFQIPEDGVKCLAGARTIALEVHTSEGAVVPFIAAGQGKHLASLEAFTHR
jgi:hypothetical protein